MEKKRSKGVTAFGLLFLWLAFQWVCWTKLYCVVSYQQYCLYPLDVIIYILLSILLILVAFLTSIGLFMLEEWARKLALGLGTYHWLYLTISVINKTYWTRIYNHNIPLYSIVIVSIFCIMLIIAPIFLLWWFFTRPKVKEQFK